MTVKSYPHGGRRRPGREIRAHLVAAFPGVAGAHGCEPRLHHLPGRQGVPDRAQAGRAARGVRAHLRALHGAGRQSRRAHARAGDAVPAPALRQRGPPRAAPSGEHDAVFVAARRLDHRRRRRRTTWRFRPDGRPVFVNTLFSCLATVSDGHSFKPLWRPPFISKLAPEDRCHLNGLAMEDGKPRYVTLVADSDVADGWRDRRADGGMVIDVATGEPCCAACRCRIRRACTTAGSGCSTPAPASSAFSIATQKDSKPVAFCPGYARGLAFIGSHAVVGLSLARENRTFQGLPLDAALAARGAEPRCGLLVDRYQERRHGRVAAHRGRGARAVRRRGASRGAQPGRDRIHHRRDPARDLDRRDLTRGRRTLRRRCARAPASVEDQSEIASD